MFEVRFYRKGWSSSTYSVRYFRNLDLAMQAIRSSEEIYDRFEIFLKIDFIKRKDLVS